MDTTKLYEKCNVTRRTTTVLNGEESFGESVVYSDIPCYIKTSKASTIESTTEQSNNQTVFITIDLGHTILIGDVITTNSIRYAVEEVKTFGLIQSANIRLKCSRI